MVFALHMSFLPCELPLLPILFPLMSLAAPMSIKKFLLITHILAQTFVACVASVKHALTHILLQDDCTFWGIYIFLFLLLGDFHLSFIARVCFFLTHINSYLECSSLLLICTYAHFFILIIRHPSPLRNIFTSYVAGIISLLIRSLALLLVLATSQQQQKHFSYSETHLLPPFQPCYWICQTMGSFLHVLPIPIPREYLRRDYMKFDSSVKQIISTPLNIPIAPLKFGSNYCGYRCINIYVFTLPAISTMISFQNSPWNTEELFQTLWKDTASFSKKSFHGFHLQKKSRATLTAMRVSGAHIATIITIVPSLCSSPWGSALKGPKCPFLTIAGKSICACFFMFTILHRNCFVFGVLTNTNISIFSFPSKEEMFHSCCISSTMNSACHATEIKNN